MVDLAARLHGWTQNVYAFGCGFIHLSAFHDYADRDPFDLLTPDDRKIIGHYSKTITGSPWRTRQTNSATSRGFFLLFSRRLPVTSSAT
jgi:hypothetical protein